MSGAPGHPPDWCRVLSLARTELTSTSRHVRHGHLGDSSPRRSDHNRHGGHYGRTQHLGAGDGARVWRVRRGIDRLDGRWLADGKTSLLIQNAALLLINIAGIYRWLPRVEAGE